MWIWIIAGAVLVVAELITTSLMFASLALGAFVAAIAAGFGAQVVWQAVVFAVVAIGAIVGLRPLVAKRFSTRSDQHSTNTLALIGATGKSTTQITIDGGQVKVRGEVWSARTDSGVVEADQPVKVRALDGVTLIVTAEQ
jgi:membrane protein implicated in regulation of membrane protease activity